MINSCFILNALGETIIEKHWRKKTPRSQCDFFWSNVLKHKIPADVPPVILSSKFVLIHVYRHSLYFLTTIRSEIDPEFVIEFLNTLANILYEYFGELNEHAIKDNFVIVYEILDEMLDNGFPLSTETNMLKSVIRPPSMLSKVIESVAGDYSSTHTEKAPEVFRTGASLVPWRGTDIKYQQNEIFIDIIESLNVIINSRGETVAMVIDGVVMLNCLLSGVPDLSLSLKNASVIDDVSLHKCIRLKRYTRDGVISFIPPDGMFQLMTYVIRKEFPLPIQVIPSITYDVESNSGFIKIQIMTRFGSPMTDRVEDTVLKISFSKKTLSVNMSPGIGSVHFDTKTKICEWNIGSIPRGKAPTMCGTVIYDENISIHETKPSIMIDFTIAQYSVTTIGVESLSIYGESYKLFKGFKNITKAGKYEFRT